MTVVIELYRVRCPDCGVKTEKVPQLPSKARRSVSVSRKPSVWPARVRRCGGWPASRAASRRKPALRQMGIDEIYLGKKQKFLTVVSNLETAEPL